MALLVNTHPICVQGLAYTRSISYNHQMMPSVPLSLALGGLDPDALGLVPPPSRQAITDRGPEVRSMIDWARSHGFRAVQLNATTPGVRARDLDRSARRDLAATLRRADLRCSGLDFFIPPEHFVDPRTVDRAVTGLLSTIDLVADLSSLATGSVVSTQPNRTGVVSVVFPGSVPSEVLSTIAEKARARSVRVADNAWPAIELSAEAGETIAIGLDPAAILAKGDDPSLVAARTGSRLASARLADLAGGMAAGGRVAPGSIGGRLDVLAYFVALLTAGYSEAVVLDLRGVPRQAEAVDLTLAVMTS